MLKKMIKAGRNVAVLVQRPYKRDKLIYGVVSGLYLAAVLGLDKTIVSGLIATAYAVLALTDDS
jgi:hypothetical protein